jgi:hypothetical protein
VDLLHDVCAGLDVSKKDVKACVRSPGARANQRHTEVRTFATTTNALLQLRDWLIEQGVTLIAMEATGDYWRPPLYLLEDDLNVILVNPAHAKALPGRKSDVSDSMWLAQLAECGLLKASFVPPAPIRQLRDLTRFRTTLSREHTREAGLLTRGRRAGRSGRRLKGFHRWNAGVGGRGADPCRGQRPLWCARKFRRLGLLVLGCCHGLPSRAAAPFVERLDHDVPYAVTSDGCWPRLSNRTKARVRRVWRVGEFAAETGLRSVLPVYSEHVSFRRAVCAVQGFLARLRR